MNENVERFRVIKNEIPFPLYCTRLRDGEFEFVNQQLLDFLLYEEGDLQNAESLYRKSAHRRRWVNMVRDSARNGAPISCLLEFQLGRIDDSGAKTRHVIDTVCLLDGDDEKSMLAVGILGVTEEWSNWILSANRVKAYRQILERIDVGVHGIDAEGKLVFMNRAERDLLRVDKEWIDNIRPHVACLSPRMHKAKRTRVDAKIQFGEENLTLGEHRAFMRDPALVKGDAQNSVPEVVPVNIFDVEVDEPNRELYRRKNREIYTIVVDERIPDDITRLFRDFGPRNPLLRKVDEVEIATFVAVQRKYALDENPEIKKELVSDDFDQDELVFTYANDAFIDELVNLTRKYPEIGVFSADDIYGKTQSDLWNLEDIAGLNEQELDFGSGFSERDRKVIEEEADDQRIEKHPSVKNKNKVTDVQVIKIPHYNRGNARQVIGVRGFYWDVDGQDINRRQEKIREQLKTLYQPFDILNNVPVPVYIKDQKLRFIYANTAYLEDLQSIQKTLLIPVSSLDDIIGRKDRDLFPAETAEEYESDDSKIITSRRKEINKVEGHGTRSVRVIKRPIKDDDDVTGVQGIFWYQHTKSDRVWVDWKPEIPILYIDDFQIEISRGKRWLLFDVLLDADGGFVSNEVIGNAIGETIESRTDRNRLATRKTRLMDSLSEKVHCKPEFNIQFNITADPEGHAYRMQIRDCEE